MAEKYLSSPGSQSFDLQSSRMFPQGLDSGSWNEDYESKTSKRMLNLNAIKFKLSKLNSDKIRYEVIYKNLVRDVRKFYSKDFNECTDFIKKKRKNNNEFFLECLNLYIQQTIGNLRNSPGVSSESLAFNLGALIYPKEML